MLNFAVSLTLKGFEELLLKLEKVVGDKTCFEPDSLQFSQRGLQKLPPEYSLNKQKTLPDILKRLTTMLHAAEISSPDAHTRREFTELMKELNKPDHWDKVNINDMDSSEALSALKVKGFDFALDTVEKMDVKKPGAVRFAPGEHEELEEFKRKDLAPAR
jgi:hypothetical protein